MSNTVRENDVDVDEIKSKMHPAEAQEALAYLNDAAALLKPLRKGYAEGDSPEILRALAIVQNALAEALQELDPDEQHRTSAAEEAYM